MVFIAGSLSEPCRLPRSLLLETLWHETIKFVWRQSSHYKILRLKLYDLWGLATAPEYIILIGHEVL